MSTGPGRLQRRALALVEAAEGRTMSRRELESVMVAEGYDKSNVYRGLHDRRLVRLREEHTLDESRVSERRTAYDALRLTAHADEKGDVRITGVFDADLTELLPESWAVAKAGAREYDASTNTQLPTLHRGVVSVGRPHLATIRTDNTPRLRFFVTLGQEPEVEVEIGL